MIVDNIRNASLYYGLDKRIMSAFKFLETQDLQNLAIGKHEIDGDKCFALVEEYDSMPVEQGAWEAHGRYTDIQYIVTGVERMGCANIEDLKVIKEYDEKSDLVLFEGEGNMLVFKPGTFAVFMPQDAHMPNIALDRPQKMLKIVMKVIMD